MMVRGKRSGETMLEKNWSENQVMALTTMVSTWSGMRGRPTAVHHGSAAWDTDARSSAKGMAVEVVMGERRRHARRLQKERNISAPKAPAQRSAISRMRRGLGAPARASGVGLRASGFLGPDPPDCHVTCCGIIDGSSHSGMLLSRASRVASSSTPCVQHLKPYISMPVLSVGRAC